jgi:hypothetical protein
MKLWIDGEWNSYKGALISMAIVDEEGREWYEVLECESPDPWIAEHVMPFLNKQPVPFRHVQESLEGFLREYVSVHIIADWPEDIERFCNLLITGPGMRIDTPLLTMEVKRTINSDASAIPHNALEDAKAMRLMDLQP